jgi:superfamily II DNA or RNA helicase
MNNIYLIYIYERFLDLKKSNKTEFDNNDLWKIFEYYCCIKLSDEYQKQFFEYDDIDPTFKEVNKMTRNDTGIDLCDLDKTIVQCKLRKYNLSWKECSTFFGSQNMFDSSLNKTIVRWNNLIIARNKESLLSDNLIERKELFIDKTYLRNDILDFCEDLILNPPIYPIINYDFKLRDYQIEAIDLIKNTNKNVIISLPTGTGKNIVIMYSIINNINNTNHSKYLILVPRIILMEQLKDEIIEHFPKMKNKIQLIGDGDNKFNETKNITICVFNSVSIIEEHSHIFDKIFIDEAHHIYKPEIYYNDDDFSDESSDDSLENEKYTDIIKSFVKYNNNVYLSATIDKIDDFEYYYKDIREMIELKHLCDYTIHVPIFNEDPTNRNICEYIIKNYKNIIIYCNSQEEGKTIYKLMNLIQNNCSEYVDCKTPKKKRKDIIAKYKNGEIPFLINVKILVEGFNAPITKGICFMHLPSSKTTLIQIIGRALRLHPLKTIANIILPFSSKDDEKNICNFLKVIANNDSKIRNSYFNKKLGGYISIDIDENIDIDDEDINEMINFKYDLIYNSLGVLLNGVDIWMKRFEDLKKYIDENNKRPSQTDKNNKIYKLASWTTLQVQKYKKKEGIMKDNEIYDTWTDFINDEKYKVYFISNEEAFNNILEQVKIYININKIRPSQCNKDKQIKYLGKWISHQITNYNQKKDIMNNEMIYNKWTEFINNPNYKKYFQSNENDWNDSFKEVKIYIDTNNKRPSAGSNDIKTKKLGHWIAIQKKNYISKTQIMSNEIIYNLWTEFIKSTKYKKYFQSNEDSWLEVLNDIKHYIDNNNKRPSEVSKNSNVKTLGSWIGKQKYNYNKKREIMSNEEIYNQWTEFINDEKYKVYFISNDEGWYNNFEDLKKYIDENNKRPYTEDKNIDIKNLGAWTSTQIQNYKKKENVMKNNEIYDTWTNFINDEKYKVYFTSNEEVWFNNFEDLKKYIDENNKRPSKKDIKSLHYWLSDQLTNYKKKEHSMKNNEIYDAWTEFINDEKYKVYFTSNEEDWFNNFEDLKKYIDENNKRPNKRDKNIDIKQLGSWLSYQSNNYKKKEYIMKDNEIYNAWTEFINNEKYKVYFS